MGVCWCPFLALESFSSCLPHHIYLLLLLLSRARKEKTLISLAAGQQEKEIPCYTLLLLVVSSLVLHLVGKKLPFLRPQDSRKRKIHVILFCASYSKLHRTVPRP